MPPHPGSIRRGGPGVLADCRGFYLLNIAHFHGLPEAGPAPLTGTLTRLGACR